MDRATFHDAFQTLCDSFPLSRVNSSVEHTWYRALSHYADGRLFFAFSQLATGPRFPNLGDVHAACKSARPAGDCFIASGDPSACYAEMLGHGDIKCACPRCKSETYKSWAEGFKRTYGRYPQVPQTPAICERLPQGPVGKPAFDALLSTIAGRLNAR